MDIRIQIMLYIATAFIVCIGRLIIKSSVSKYYDLDVLYAYKQWKGSHIEILDIVFALIPYINILFAFTTVFFAADQCYKVREDFKSYCNSLGIYYRETD